MIEEVSKALEIIQNGGIILYPTDTVWGIGCDATNPEAIQKVFDLKKRVNTKSMIVLTNGDRMMHYLFNDIPELAWELIDLSEKPTTLVLDQPKNIAPALIAEDNTLAVRMVKDEPFVYKLLERLKKPLVSTSANISGAATAATFKDISPEIINGVDYVVNYGQDKKAQKPSAIIKISRDNQIKIIRQ